MKWNVRPYEMKVNRLMLWFWATRRCSNRVVTVNVWRDETESTVWRHDDKRCISLGLLWFSSIYQTSHHHKTRPARLTHNQRTGLSLSSGLSSDSEKDQNWRSRWGTVMGRTLKKRTEPAAVWTDGRQRDGYERMDGKETENRGDSTELLWSFQSLQLLRDSFYLINI